MFATSLLLALAVAGQPSRDTVPLYADLGDHHQPISTAVPAAQSYFDQGMRLYYGFNHAEAVRSFRAAQRLDPTCAICFWGEALALGPNINLPMDSSAGAAAFAAIEQARALSIGASPRERALIHALAARYAPQPTAPRAPLDSAYARAMGEVVRADPSDLESAVLHAEALMDLRPWNYWTADGEPQPGMAAAIEALERVTTTAPTHPGACHFHIHLVESVHPERAVACAERLARLMPGAGHIVHMPGHIYIRVGRYVEAIMANEHAAHVDERFIRDQRPGVGIYTAGYYPHNYDFMAFAASMAGRSEQALSAAGKLAALAGQHAMEEPGMEFLQHHATRLLQLQVRFGRWEAILATPAPAEPLLHARAIWHYGRGRALAHRGEIAGAEVELAALRAIAADPRLAGMRLEFNGSQTILRIAERVLTGATHRARGEGSPAIAALREAVRLEDALGYGEPPDWTLPVRQELGDALLAQGEAPEAERAFRADLKRFPRNGWSLAGLAAALRAQARDREASAVEAELRDAWGAADIPVPVPSPALKAGSGTAAGSSGIARIADLGTCRTEGGEPVLDCRIIYRTFGTLNAARDNAVLIPTWHGGRSETMTFILGAENWVDTTRYFAILVDKLGNGESTSPSNSARQPGARFPRVTVGDMVDAQHRLLREHLRIPRLHAVLGWSLGGIQSLAWGLRHPESVGRVISVAGTPRMGTSEMYVVNSMRTLLTLGQRAGLSQYSLGLRLAELWHTVATTPAYENLLPRDSVAAMIAREAEVDWAPFHPEDNRLQLDAVAEWDGFGELAEARRKARRLPSMLLLFMPDDHVTTAENFRAFAPLVGADTVAFASACGHMAPVCETAAIGGHVRSYLERTSAQWSDRAGSLSEPTPRPRLP